MGTDEVLEEPSGREAQEREGWLLLQRQYKHAAEHDFAEQAAEPLENGQGLQKTPPVAHEVGEAVGEPDAEIDANEGFPEVLQLAADLAGDPVGGCCDSDHSDADMRKYHFVAVLENSSGAACLRSVVVANDDGGVFWE